MSIRQIRINKQQEIRQRITEFKGKKIQVVLTDQTAAVGELKDIESEAIILENGRLKKNRILFTQISELYFDQVI